MASSGDPTRDGALVDRIRADIVRGDYAPGQRLVEVELAEQYGVSRGVVRSALLQLDHERLVERIANRGARVRLVSVDEAVAITEVRMVLEGLCASKAAQHITDEDVRALREIGRLMKESVRNGEILTYSALNTQLHDRLRTMANQPVAAEMLSSLLARNVRHQFRLALRPGRPQISLPEHLAIIDEVCAGNAESAERAARRHVASVIEALRSTDQD